MSNSDDGVYGDGDIRKLYSLPPDHNDDDVSLIRTQTHDQPEHGTRDPWLWFTGGKVGRYGAGDQ